MLRETLRTIFGAENTVPHLVSARKRNATHTNVTSQTIIYPNPNPNQKKMSNLRPETLTLFLTPTIAHRDGGGRTYKKG